MSRQKSERIGNFVVARRKVWVWAVPMREGGRVVALQAGGSIGAYTVFQCKKLCDEVKVLIQ